MFRKKPFKWLVLKIPAARDPNHAREPGFLCLPVFHKPMQLKRQKSSECLSVLVTDTGGYHGAVWPEEKAPTMSYNHKPGVWWSVWWSVVIGVVTVSKSRCLDNQQLSFMHPKIASDCPITMKCKSFTPYYLYFSLGHANLNCNSFSISIKIPSFKVFCE